MPKVPPAADTKPSANSRSKAKRKPGRLQLEDYLPYRLSVASNEVSRLIARAYEDRFGLTVPQWRLLAVLAQNGPLIQQELGVRMVLDKVTVSRAAQGLVARNLIERSENHLDGRSHVISLTPLGSDLYAEVAPAALAFESILLDQWSDEEVEQLKRQLFRLQRTAASLARFGFFPTQAD